MAKRVTPYDHMSASQLAQITRERGLTKPDGLMNAGDWAAWLDDQRNPSWVVSSGAAPAVGEPVSEAEASTLPAAEVEVADANPYADWSKAQLQDEAKRRQIDTTALKTKPELVDALLASDGVSEDQQVALDNASGAPAQPENE